MRRRRPPSPAPFGVALLLALGLHALVARPFAHWLLDRKGELPETKPLPQAPVETTLISEEELEELLEKTSRPSPERPITEVKPPEPPKAALKLDRQVVEIPPPAREEVPEKADYLSEYDSKTDKQTRSRNNESPRPAMTRSEDRVISGGDDPNGGRERPDPLRPKPEEGPRGQKPGPGRDVTDPSERVGSRQPTPNGNRVADPRPDTEELEEKVDGNLAQADPQSDLRLRSGGEGPSGGTSEGPESWTGLLPTLGPDDSALKQGSIDHLPDIERGDVTSLNTRQSKYAWFFNRVKSAVQERWPAVEVHRRHDPYGRVYGYRDRQTVVDVTLRADGTLEDIFVRKDSGVVFLDDAAVQAFRDAQPFPNPPLTLQDPDGRIRFSFAFYLEIDGTGGYLFRPKPYQ